MKLPCLSPAQLCYYAIFWVTCYSVDIKVRNCLSKCCMFWQDHKQIYSPQRFRGLCIQSC